MCTFSNGKVATLSLARLLTGKVICIALAAAKQEISTKAILGRVVPALNQRLTWALIVGQQAGYVALRYRYNTHYDLLFTEYLSK